MKLVTNPMTFETEYKNFESGEVFIIDVFTPWSQFDEEDEVILWNAVKKIEEEKCRKTQQSS